jgi:hypothetical protein
MKRSRHGTPGAVTRVCDKKEAWWHEGEVRMGGAGQESEEAKTCRAGMRNTGETGGLTYSNGLSGVLLGRLLAEKLEEVTASN